MMYIVISIAHDNEDPNNIKSNIYEIKKENEIYKFTENLNEILKRKLNENSDHE